MAKVNTNTAAATVAAATAPTYVVKVQGPAHKYSKAPKALSAGSYAITAHGATVAAAGGIGATKAGGSVTVMGLVAVAAAYASKRAGGKPVSTGAIVAAMRALPAVQAAYGATKAGMYAPAGTLPCPAWCAGYVRGAATPKGGSVLAKA